MSISVKVSNAWKSLSSPPSVLVGGAWKACKNVYVKKDGLWYSLYQNTMNFVTPDAGVTKTLSNVRVGSTITISGVLTNNTYDSGDNTTCTPTGATLLTGSEKWGPSSGTYTNTYSADVENPSFYFTRHGVTNIQITISYFVAKA